jgi:hypothetical protein
MGIVRSGTLSASFPTSPAALWSTRSRPWTISCKVRSIEKNPQPRKLLGELSQFFEPVLGALATPGAREGRWTPACGAWGRL